MLRFFLSERAWNFAPFDTPGVACCDCPMTLWTEPPALPDDAEAWAWLATRVPQLAGLHLRAGALRSILPLAGREQRWRDLMADLDNLPMPDDVRRFAVDVLARAGRCETFLPGDQPAATIPSSLVPF